jgi:hypothetical protein
MKRPAYHSKELQEARVARLLAQRAEQDNAPRVNRDPCFKCGTRLDQHGPQCERQRR